ncbi:unnamed protein product [Didymodactylos carnosus]|uniref:Uncharacterized protein n=1 Tax=Didymodactylos carnosus TaxID=1234261 RepID=A0A813UQB0_9BILA|nr:unnamed protein product [Didymodactylos carnosus]CAF3616253.1 unnamed protein product [Didymodactylos carnosus]
MKFLIIFLLQLLLVSCTYGFSWFSNWFGGKHSHCPVALYSKDSSYCGYKLYAQKSFHPTLEQIGQYAKECKVKVNVKQSFINDGDQIIPKINDYTQMAFHLGLGFEYELLDTNERLLCNRVCLNKPASQIMSEANCFTSKLKSIQDIKQDAFRPEQLVQKFNTTDTLALLELKRKDLQEKCKNLKM